MTARRSVHPLGLPKIDLDLPGYAATLIDGTRVRTGPCGDGVRVEDFSSPTVVLVSTPHGAFRGVLDPQSYRGLPDETLPDFAGLVRTQGPVAARAAVLAGLAARGLSPEVAAELVPFALACRQVGDVGVEDLVAGADPTVRAAARAVLELLSGFERALSAAHEVAELSCTLTDVDRRWLPMFELVGVAELSRRDLWVVDEAFASGSPAVLTALAGDPFDEVRERAASCAATPVEALWVLAHDTVRCDDSEYEDVPVAVARRVDLPHELFEFFARHHSVPLRCAVARNTTLPSDLFAVLVNDGDRAVLSGVAANPAIPPHLLSGVLARYGPEVGEFAGRNPALPLDVLVSCARSDTAKVRVAVAQNVAAPHELLDELSSDEDHTVRTAVAGNVSTATATLAALSSDMNFGVREVAAQHPAMPSSCLAQLAHTRSVEVRVQVARNQRTPDATIEQLMGDTNNLVRVWARHEAERRAL